MRLKSKNFILWLVIFCGLFVMQGMCPGYEKTFFEDLSFSAPLVEEKELDSLGVFKIYAYCPCKKCCGNNAQGITKTGTQATQGRTIAVDPDVIPLGSAVIIDGAEYIAEDTGTGIDGQTIDMFFDSHQDAVNWGVKYLEVKIK